MKEYNLPEQHLSRKLCMALSCAFVLMNDHETRKRATDRDVALHFGVDTWKALQEHEIRLLRMLTAMEKSKSRKHRG